MCPIVIWMMSLKHYERAMKVTVEISGQLLADRPRQQFIEVKKGATAGDVAATLGLNAGEIGLVVVNGVQSELEDLLPPDCRLCFFPYLSGG